MGKPTSDEAGLPRGTAGKHIQPSWRAEAGAQIGTGSGAGGNAVGGGQAGGSHLVQSPETGFAAQTYTEFLPRTIRPPVPLMFPYVSFYVDLGR
jgi:hypothetical protein